jgi:hypothetical protein
MIIEMEADENRRTLVVQRGHVNFSIFATRLGKDSWWVPGAFECGRVSLEICCSAWGSLLDARRLVDEY